MNRHYNFAIVCEHMPPLDKSLRNQLERTVKEARCIAEAASKAALEQLGVGEAKPYPHLSDQNRKLRIKLRAHGRQLGDVRDAKTEVQEIDRLLEEVAYEHWHRMLFARFLAENNLLMYPDPADPVPVTLEECEDLAADEGAKNGWELAARFAARMLPQIFRIDSPVFQVVLSPEHEQKLEHLVAELPQEIFTASDSLGWVYQFWQAKKKDEVNASEVKIGARELPAVTQLFTEPYMVSFLLDNSLGAWWVAHMAGLHDGIERKPDAKKMLQTATSEQELRDFFALPGVPLAYLRFVKSPSPPGRGVRGEGEKKTIPSDILNNARNLRKNQADAEQLLWGLLRDRRFAGKKFRRQHPVDRYILDFYCHEEKLAIELDGGQHNEHKNRADDEERTSYLNKQGIRVLRFWNNHVFQETEPVLQSIYNALQDKGPHPNPLPEGEGLSWIPAAGTFDGWPKNLSELKTLDPCCGSGHFLAAAFLMLVAMRMELEKLSAREAVDAVLRQNIHGLEIDKRCVELAAFALAFAAWRYPDLSSIPPRPLGEGWGEGIKPIGYRPLPELNLACTGLSVSVTRSEWEKLANGDSKLRVALVGLYEEFKNAPVLGSLIDPMRSAVAKLIQWDELANALEKALQKDRVDEEREAGVAAQGLAKAAQLLAVKYRWIITNVPYLARGKQCETLRNFCEKNYPEAKNDLATVFLDRCLELCAEAASSRSKRQDDASTFGTVSVVLPQNWLFLTTYKKFREKLLKKEIWHLIARLGPGAFETISGEVVKAILITLSWGKVEEASGLFKRQDAASSLIRGLDVSEPRTAVEKAAGLLTADIKSVEQAKQLENPDARVALEEAEDIELLETYAQSLQGVSPADAPRYGRCFWELNAINGDWCFWQSTIDDTIYCGGKELVLWYGQDLKQAVTSGQAYIRGVDAWGKQGIVVRQMRELPCSLYSGDMFDTNCAVITPHDPAHLPAIWCFCSSLEYNEAVRRIDQKLNVTNATLVKVPFDLDRWTKIAAEKYPNGLPKPYSDDPTQWIFHGHPCGSVIWDEEKNWTVNGPLRTDETVLQIAVVRLLGYRWPAELDAKMELADEQREWVKGCEALLPFADKDGIVCIPPVGGESSGPDRVLNLLAAAFNQHLSPSGRGAGGEGGWTNDTMAQLLKNADHKDKTLETWLREKFFTQHCKLFHHRPFIWHIWDGLRDGFAVLVNYHKLDYKKLETLIYTYLGDWINRQKQDIARGVDGAQEKLAAAENLKKSLELILEGEAPYDIFIRWKPIDKQPIGWTPDLNDGVRLNIRPFMSVPDAGKKGAGVLRDKPNINWNKDRGKDVKSAPWYHLFKGDRINDHHLTIEEKSSARKGKGGS